MKKILILANSSSGLYRFRKDLIEELIKQGYKIYVSVPYEKLLEPLERMGCKFIDISIDRRGINPIKDLKLIKSYQKLIKKINPHIILTYTIKPNIYGGIVSRLNKIPYVVNITGLGTTFQKNGIMKNLIIYLYRFALKQVKVVVFENQGNQQVFIDNIIIAKDKTVLLNGAGVNLQEFRFYSLPDKDIIRFVFIGRIMKEKGVDELFLAAQKIKKEFNNVEFDILGGFEEDYKDVISKLQDQGIINYYGYRRDVKYFIKRAHCCILPSYHEGMSNVLLESAACGRPLITSDIYGCKETVIDGKSGYLVRPKDQEDLYNKILDFIKIEDEVKQKMGIESRKHIEEIFDKRNIVRETTENIRKVFMETKYEK